MKCTITGMKETRLSRFVSKRPLSGRKACNRWLSVQLRHDVGQCLPDAVLALEVEVMHIDFNRFSQDGVSSFNLAEAFMSFSWGNFVCHAVFIGPGEKFIAKPAATFICDKLLRSAKSVQSSVVPRLRCSRWFALNAPDRRLGTWWHCPEWLEQAISSSPRGSKRHRPGWTG